MNKDRFRCYAACSFGLERAVLDELRRMGAENIDARDARVYFSADADMLARANLRLSSADRIYLVLNEFKAATFDELFDGIESMDWGEILPKSANFPVLGDSVRSALKSVPDIQAISKKAIVQAMRRKYGISFYREEGERYAVYVSILKDVVTVSLNTSGDGLNRRGYRVRNTKAPLRETLAAGMIRLTRWYDRPFYDPMCGSGTIAIEAAMKAMAIAPGLSRDFDAKHWSDEMAAAFRREKTSALSEKKNSTDVEIFASDIDEKTLNIAKFHARRAGVLNAIHFSTADVRSFSPQTETGTIVTNPPYAIRIGEADEVHELYASLGERIGKLSGFKKYFITADEHFERYYGIPADKKRKLYNGNIKCGFYQYFKNENGVSKKR